MSVFKLGFVFLWALSLPAFPDMSPESVGVAEEIFDEYRMLNERETRYLEYRDSDDMLAAKLAQLMYVNRSRSRHGLPSVRLDILASRVANRVSKEAAERGFWGHWNERGEKPYHRYAFAGGLDHVAENAAAKTTTGKFAETLETTVSFMRELHDRFMAEVPPNDGHRRNILDANHNFVGLGAYLSDNQFRYYEEFIDRYLDFNAPRTNVRINEEFSVEIRPSSGEHFLYAVIAYYESNPRPLTVAQLRSKGSYRDYTSNQVLALWPWDLESLRGARYFAIPLRFSQPGLYYVHIYLDDEPFAGRGASTSGKIQASGLVISVRR